MPQCEMSITLPCTVRYDGEAACFVSHCVPLRLYSAAETEDESLEAIKSAIALYLQTAFEDGRLGEMLQSNRVSFTLNQAGVARSSRLVSRLMNAESRCVPVSVPMGIEEEREYVFA